MLETLDHTIRIGSTPTFLYFDLYLYSAYAAHYVYVTFMIGFSLTSKRDIFGHTLKFIYVNSLGLSGVTTVL